MWFGIHMHFSISFYSLLSQNSSKHPGVLLFSWCNWQGLILSVLQQDSETRLAVRTLKDYFVEVYLLDAHTHTHEILHSKCWQQCFSKWSVK